MNMLDTVLLKKDVENEKLLDENLITVDKEEHLLNDKNNQTLYALN